jgi:hypothetical protein
VGSKQDQVCDHTNSWSTWDFTTLL